MCPGLTYEFSLVIFNALTRPGKVILKIVSPSGQLGSLTMCLSDNMPLSSYSDEANGDYGAVRPFAVVQEIFTLCQSHSFLFDVNFPTLFYSIHFFFLYTWFSFHPPVNARVDSAHITLFPLLSLKLIYFISSTLTAWWPSRGQEHPDLHWEYYRHNTGNKEARHGIVRQWTESKGKDILNSPHCTIKLLNSGYIQTEEFNKKFNKI